MATWQTTSLNRVLPGVATAQTAIGAYSAIASSNLGARVASMTGLLETLIPAGAAFVDQAGAAMVNVVTALMTDLLGTGFYAILIFPEQIDYNRIAIAERLREQEQMLARLSELPVRAEPDLDPIEADLQAKKEELRFLHNQKAQVQSEMLLIGARNGAVVHPSGDLQEGTLIREDEERRRDLIFEINGMDLRATRLVGEINSLEHSLATRPRPPRSTTTRDEVDAAKKRVDDLRRQLHFARTDRPLVFRLSDVLDALESSLYDVGDSKRPQFGPTSLITAGMVVAGADRLQDFLNAARAVAAVFRLKKLARKIDMLAQATAQADARARPAVRRGAYAPPDWATLSLASIFGLEKAVADLKRNAASTGLRATPGITQALGFAQDVLAAVRAASQATQNVLDALTAIAGAGVSVDLLFIPPVDGQRAISVEGSTVYIPNGTYGNDGFIRAVREATGAVQHDYCMAFVLLAGAPALGLGSLFGGFPADVEAILNSTISSTQAQVIRNAIDAAVTSVRGQASQLQTIFGRV